VCGGVGQALCQSGEPGLTRTDTVRAWITDAKRTTAKTKAARKPAMKTYTLPKEDVDILVA